MSKRTLIISSLLIFILAVFCFFFVFGQFLKINLPSFFKKNFKFGLDLEGGSRLIYEANMKDIPEKDRRSALEGVRDVIERRVNMFGISEATVRTNISGQKYRIIVELPGVKDLKKALDWIGKTPYLEFREQNPLPELTAEQKKEISDYNEKAKQKAQSILEKLKNGANFEKLVKNFSEDESSKKNNGDIGWYTNDQISKVFGQNYLTEILNLKKGENLSQLIETDFNYYILRKIDASNEKIRLSAIVIKKKTKYDFIDFKNWQPWKRTDLDGSKLKTARVEFDQISSKPVVALEFKKDGVELFKEITKRNVGKPLAIFLDGKSIIDTNGDGIIDDSDLYAPIVKEEIPSGRAIISGNISLKEAKILAQRLQNGALPVDIGQPIYQKTIGPTLGMISLSQVLKAFMFGFLAIILFMILYYRLLGLVASIALIIYILILGAFFKLIPVTLTLAGIGGAILSVGMAVDANILIFERWKEEIKEKQIDSAKIEAFRRAWSAIRDGNFTTLLVAFIMFELGTSFVRGFSITLSLGIMTSLFSAMVATRIILELILKTPISRIKYLLFA